MKPRIHGDRKFTPGKANATSGQGKRHIRARQMPHLSKANATPHTHPSVAFAPTKCGIRDAEVWHFQTISQTTSQMKSANNFPKINSNNSTKNEKFPSARHRHPWPHQRKSQDHLPPVQRHPRTQRQQIPLHRPGQGRVLLPPLRLQALRARRCRRTGTPAAKRELQSCPQAPLPLPPPRLRPQAHDPQREAGAILDAGTLPGATPAGRPAHHRRTGEATRKLRRGELSLLQLLRRRHAHQHQVSQRPEALHDGEGCRAYPLQHRRHTGHPGMHHHRRRIRCRRLHDRRPEGCHLRARRRAKQPQLDGSLRRKPLRTQEAHLHRCRRGQLRTVTEPRTGAAPRIGPLPPGALRPRM